MLGKKNILKKLNILGLIPARSGSKGIKNKNIRLYRGKPLIYYAIKNSLNSKYINKTICSSDSARVLNIASRLGAETSFIRPKKYANDFSNDFPFTYHAINWLEKNEKWKTDIIVILRPTAPLRKVIDIDRAIKLLVSNKAAHSIKSIIPVSQNPYKMWQLTNKKFISPIVMSNIFEQYNSPRAMLPTVFWQNGYIDIVKASIVYEYKSVHGLNILPYIMKSEDKIDIDTEEDLKNLNRYY